MNCEHCPLNIDSKSFQPRMMTRVPLYFRNVFICNNDCSIGKHQYSLCSKDLWVLTFIGQREKFALDNAVSTMDNIVKMGFSELLCSLFENAPYETRREMWQRMTKEHYNRLYLFDALFEKECLAPLTNKEDFGSDLAYQNCLLFPELAYNAV